MVALGARAHVCLGLRYIRRHGGLLLAIVPEGRMVQSVINEL